jgi:hypothetical protein
MQRREENTGNEQKKNYAYGTVHSLPGVGEGQKQSVIGFTPRSLTHRLKGSQNEQPSACSVHREQFTHFLEIRSGEESMMSVYDS